MNSISFEKKDNKIVGTNIYAKKIIDQIMNSLSKEEENAGLINQLLCVFVLDEDENECYLTQDKAKCIAERFNTCSQYSLVRFSFETNEAIFILDLKEEILISRTAKDAESIERLRQLSRLQKTCRQIIGLNNVAVYVCPIYYKSLYESHMQRMDDMV